MFSYVGMLKALKYFVETNCKRTASISKTCLPKISQFLKTTSHNMDGPDFGDIKTISCITADIGTQEEFIAALVIIDFLTWLSEKANGGTMGRAGMLKHISDAEAILNKAKFTSPMKSQSKDNIISKVEAIEDMVENLIDNSKYKEDFIQALEDVHEYIIKH